MPVSEAIAVSRPKARRRGIIALQLLLVLGFLGIFAYAFQSTVLAPRSAIPGRLGELKLVSKVEGEAALAQVDRLHGTGIALADAYVATYTRNNSQLQAWVGLAHSEAEADELIQKMTEGIKKGRSPFSNLRQVTVSGKEVLQVDGPGGSHFFYIAGDRVIWLILEDPDAQTILPVAVETFARDSGWASAPRGY